MIIGIEIATAFGLAMTPVASSRAKRPEDEQPAAVQGVKKSLLAAI